MSKQKRRQGLCWETDLYQKFVMFIVNNQLSLNKETVKNMTLNDVEKLSLYIYPRYGHYKSHKISVLSFFETELENIVDDCISK